MPDPILLSIAKSAIVHKLDASYIFDEEKLLELNPFLKEEGAVFVTLKYDKDLRGCIGSIVSHRTLYEDVVHNAVSAAFNDPRFKPLSMDELSHIYLEVSVLSKPEILEYEDFEDLCKKVEPYKDGLILKHGVYQGTFLPQVWEQLSSPREFLGHLSMKAGADPSIYEQKPSIYRYRVDALEDLFENVALL